MTCVLISSFLALSRPLSLVRALSVSLSLSLSLSEDEPTVLDPDGWRERYEDEFY
jgi:hypothetical protein